MSHFSYLTPPNFIGFFELDLARTVLYSRKTVSGLTTEKAEYLVGEDFFEKVADFENSPELRRRFKDFIKSHHSTDHFFFECRSLQGSLPVKVLMWRGSEKNESQSKEIVILDIRKKEI
jgi:hypothetical protein